MFRTCRHLMPTGRTCQSAAMRTSAYCYFHARLHLGLRRPRPDKKKILAEKLDSREAILSRVSLVIDGLATRKLDAGAAGRILYGLQIASDNLEPSRPTAKLPGSRP